jgi:hypothetical protein
VHLTMYMISYYLNFFKRCVNINFIYIIRCTCSNPIPEFWMVTHYIYYIYIERVTRSILNTQLDSFSSVCVKGARDA